MNDELKVHLRCAEHFDFAAAHLCRSNADEVSSGESPFSSNRVPKTERETVDASLNFFPIPGVSSAPPSLRPLHRASAPGSPSEAFWPPQRDAGCPVANSQ